MVVMDVQILLDRDVPTYTNLDVLSGRVVVNLPNSTSISSVSVRLEGECTVKLPSQGGGGSPRKWLSKARRILQQNQILFPPAQFQGKSNHGPLKLVAGDHEFPFLFTFPQENESRLPDSDTGQISKCLPIQKKKASSVPGDRMLPPSFSYSNGVKIRYWVGAEVVTPTLLSKSSFRASKDFHFVPTHPLHRMWSGEFTMVRQLNLQLDLNKPTEKRNPLTLNVQIYLQNGTMLVCREDVPLRILLKEEDIGGSGGEKEQLYLQNIQIMVLGYTHLRFKGVTATVPDSWTIQSLSNINVILTSPETNRHGKSRGISVDHSLWSRRPLPESVVPSFEARNICRRYELEVKVGLQYASGNTKLVSLCFPVQVSNRPPFSLSLPLAIPATSASNSPPQTGGESHLVMEESEPPRFISSQDLFAKIS